MSFSLTSDFRLPKKLFFICFNEIPLKMMKNASHFILKAVFILKIFKFCLDFLVMKEKRLDLKDMIDFKIYDVTAWLTNNYNTHITQYLMN